MKKLKHLLFILAIPLILSCWNGSSPTSDKAETFIIGGIVADKAGAGIEGVSVQITGVNFSLSDTTDSEGNFTFDGVESGAYKVKACKDSCFFKPANIEFSVEKTDIDTLKFTTADSYVHGRVVDIINGEGIEGISVMVEKRVGSSEISLGAEGITITDSDGEFGFYDLEKSAYGYYFRPNYYTLVGNLSFSIEEAAFARPEIILQDFYLSSENLPITKAEFIKETKTLNLEWKPSVSQYISSYFVFILKKPEDINSSDFAVLLTIGGYYVSENNKDSRQIKYQYVQKLFDENLISGEVFMGVAPVYKIGNRSYYGPCSDTIKIQLYW